MIKECKNILPLELAENCKMDFEGYFFKSNTTQKHATVTELGFVDGQDAGCTVEGHTVFKMR